MGHRYSRPWLNSQSIPSAGVKCMMNPRWRKKLAIDHIYFGNGVYCGCFRCELEKGAEFFKKNIVC